MEEVRQLVQEEGREARNLVAFHVAVDTPARVSRKPPRALPPARRAPPRATRIRSASAGRDKRSELRARYWALLFGDLQRSVGEIYNTVEAHENLNECQEVILVLENYTRDFKALGEWFRLKWEYDNTPPPQRPQSLAWEIRKTDFVRPESRRNYSVKSSPSVSGKNSPCLSGYNTPSGKNSPNLTGKSSPGSGKISPRISNYSSSSPKAAIEFFSNKVVVSKATAKPEPKITKESSRLSDINEKDVKETSEEVLLAKELPTDKEDDKDKQQHQDINKPTIVEIGTAKEYKNACPNQVIIKSPKHSASKFVNSNKIEHKSSQAIVTISQLDTMENNFLQKQLTANQAKNENMINQDIEKENDKIDIGLVQSTVISDNPPINSETPIALNISSIADISDVTIDKSDVSDMNTNTATVIGLSKSNEKIEEKDNILSESPTKSEDNFADISNESSPKIEINKTAIENVEYTNDEIADKASVLKINSTINGELETVIFESVNLTSSGIGNTELERNQGFSENNIKTIQHSTAVYEKKTSYHENQITINTNSINVDQNDKKNSPSPSIHPSIYNKEKAKYNDTNKSDNIANNPIESKVEFAEILVQDIEKNEKIIESKQSAEDLIEDKEESKKDQDFKKSDYKSNDLKLSPNDLKQHVKPAYSQAAAKPKTLSTTKTEVKTPTRLARSSNAVDIRPTTAANIQKSFQKKSQGNKCSYPFNLTTGRTNLFDGAAPTVTTTKGTIPKRPFRNTQLVSGDCKTLSSKDVVKKRPPIPTSVKVADKTDKKERENPILEKNKDSKHYSSSDTVVTQIDASRLESSESLKTLGPDDHSRLQDVANSIEVLNVDNSKNDNEGWLTVKSRRLSRESKKHSKLHWANRFNQPSATTSLPTLNMIVSPKQEVKEIVDTKSDKDPAKSEQPESVEKPIESPEKHVKTEKVVKVLAKMKSVTKTKDPSMIRQKSDVTGLRTKSSRSKLLAKRAEKVKDSENDENELTKNRLHSSLESLTSALARSQESTEGAFDFDKWKSEFKSTFKYLDDDDQIPDQNEILKTADPSEMSEIAAMTSEIEENERKISWALDFQSEVDQRKLCEEEDLLNRQILELQQVSDIDIDTETDDTETDAEILCEDPRPQDCPTDTLGTLTASLEDQYETALAGMSWAERVDTLVVLEALVARDPGRAQQLHAKLSQGIRRRGSLQDALRRLQAKQARAERQRIEYQTERAKKIHQLLARVEEVKVAKNQLIDEKRIRMERRLQKAAENRDQHLKDIVRKAHDEDEKLREIAFIKQLEAENRRHEFLEQCRTHTTRLRQMRRDQLHKLEQKAAREKAVGARRQALEAARKLHCESLVSKRRERDARVEELKELKKQERGDAAREKAEGIKSRLSALAAAAELEADALRSRIRDKQDASQQRLESHLQAIREKAITGNRQTTTSESQETTPNEVEDNSKWELERKEREKQKLIKRKARKIKQRLLAEGNSNPIFDETISVDDSFLNPMTGKVYKVISSVRNIIVPLVKTIKDIRQQDNDIINIEEDKTNKKKKKPKANVENKTVNGNNSNNDEATTSTHVEKNEVKGETNKKEKEVEDKKKEEEQGDAKKKKEKAEGDEKTKKEKMEGEAKKKKEEEGDEKTNKEKVEGDEKKRKEEEGDEKTNKEKVEGGEKKKKEEEEGEKKKKKEKEEGEKKKKKEKVKLGKANSVSSSSSDIIRLRRKEKVKTDLDLPFLEKQMNELHRLMDKFERMDMLEKVTIQRYQAVKVIMQMLNVAAEKEDLNPPISAKCLTNGLLLVSRLMVSCTATAAQLLATDICVHEATLLARQLEKNNQTDIKEVDFTKQLADSLSVAMDSVLCASRLRDEHLVEKEEEAMVLVMLRNRAHQMISYLCLTGAIARTEFAGEARGHMQTLLTVCVDLCQPFEPDIGTDRNFARLALKTALGKSICGCRAEFCMLFARGVDLEHCGDFVKAARTAHLLRSIAEMDHQIVQDAFGEGAWPLEFRAAVARLLSQHAPHEKEAPRTTTLHLSSQTLVTTLSETMVLDLIVLVGFVVVNNPQLQETICDGWSVIKTLCTLPANWFVTKKRSHALLPTLIALAERPASAELIGSVLNFKILEEFLDSPDAQLNRLVQVIKQARMKKPGKKCHTNIDRLNTKLASECTLDEASFVKRTGLR